MATTAPDILFLTKQKEQGGDDTIFGCAILFGRQKVSWNFLQLQKSSADFLKDGIYTTPSKVRKTKYMGTFGFPIP